MRKREGGSVLSVKRVISWEEREFFLPREFVHACASYPSAIPCTELACGPVLVTATAERQEALGRSYKRIRRDYKRNLDVITP
jgi:hypothetical protein